jgi:hypothetical protein
MTKIRCRAKNIGTIEYFLSANECEDDIRLGETVGFEEAPVSTASGMVMMKDVRNNDRVMVDDPRRAQDLYERLSSRLGPRFEKKWIPVGLNERLRIYRYDIGQKFDWHRDGYFERENDDRSQFTFMVYLSDDFEGGATSFCDDRLMPDGPIRIRSETRMALLFDHPITHCGDAVTNGRKYVLRTDVMYRRAK